MIKEQYIIEAKQFRKEMDDILQRMKTHRGQFTTTHPDPTKGEFDNFGEVIANHIISIRDLESAIMRQGMVLKNIGNPTPYPESYNPNSTAVEPTADNLKL